MGKKILVVDDAVFMRTTVQNTLKKAGYIELVEAGNGAQAVEQFNKEHPDLVVMDITMPEMDGLQALKAIKEADPSAKVVMCSAMGQESMVIEAINLGALDFIVKPFKPDRLLKTVSTILG